MKNHLFCRIIQAGFRYVQYVQVVTIMLMFCDTVVYMSLYSICTYLHLMILFCKFDFITLNDHLLHIVFCNLAKFHTIS